MSHEITQQSINLPEGRHVLKIIPQRAGISGSLLPLARQPQCKSLHITSTEDSAPARFDSNRQYSMATSSDDCALGMNLLPDDDSSLSESALYPNNSPKIIGMHYSRHVPKQPSHSCTRIKEAMPYSVQQKSLESRRYSPNSTPVTQTSQHTHTIAGTQNIYNTQETTSDIYFKQSDMDVLSSSIQLPPASSQLTSSAITDTTGQSGRDSFEMFSKHSESVLSLRNKKTEAIGLQQPIVASVSANTLKKEEKHEPILPNTSQNSVFQEANALSLTEEQRSIERARSIQRIKTRRRRTERPVSFREDENPDSFFNQTVLTTLTKDLLPEDRQRMKMARKLETKEFSELKQNLLKQWQDTDETISLIIAEGDQFVNEVTRTLVSPSSVSDCDLLNNDSAIDELQVELDQLQKKHEQLYSRKGNRRGPLQNSSRSSSRMGEQSRDNNSEDDSNQARENPGSSAMQETGNHSTNFVPLALRREQRLRNKNNATESSSRSLDCRYGVGKRKSGRGKPRASASRSAQNTGIHLPATFENQQSTVCSEDAEDGVSTQEKDDSMEGSDNSNEVDSKLQDRKKAKFSCRKGNLASTLSETNQTLVSQQDTSCVNSTIDLSGVNPDPSFKSQGDDVDTDMVTAIGKNNGSARNAQVTERSGIATRLRKRRNNTRLNVAAEERNFVKSNPELGSSDEDSFEETKETNGCVDDYIDNSDHRNYTSRPAIISSSPRKEVKKSKRLQKQKSRMPPTDSATGTNECTELANIYDGGKKSFTTESIVIDSIKSQHETESDTSRSRSVPVSAFGHDPHTSSQSLSTENNVNRRKGTNKQISDSTEYSCSTTLETIDNTTPTSIRETASGREEEVESSSRRSRNKRFLQKRFQAGEDLEDEKDDGTQVSMADTTDSNETSCKKSALVSLQSNKGEMINNVSQSRIDPEYAHQSLDFTVSSRTLRQQQRLLRRIEETHALKEKEAASSISTNYSTAQHNTRLERGKPKKSPRKARGVIKSTVATENISEKSKEDKVELTGFTTSQPELLQRPHARHACHDNSTSETEDFDRDENNSVKENSEELILHNGNLEKYVQNDDAKCSHSELHVSTNPIENEHTNCAADDEKQNDEKQNDGERNAHTYGLLRATTPDSVDSSNEGSDCSHTSRSKNNKGYSCNECKGTFAHPPTYSEHIRSHYRPQYDSNSNTDNTCKRSPIKQTNPVSRSVFFATTLLK